VYDVVIRGGTVINANGQTKADVAVEGGKIVRVAPVITGSTRQEIDAAGLHLFPGLIDPHVHFNEPGREAWEGIETGTRALAAGGVTTFFDMPLNSSPPVTTVEAFDAKQALMQQKSRVNGYLWGGLIPGNLDQLEGLHRRGVIGFKAFMSNSGIDEFPAVDDYTLYKGMDIAAKLDSMVAVHAENDSITGGLSAKAIAEGRGSVRDYLASRPVIAEVEAIQRAILLAEETGCRLYIVHISSAEGVERVTEARRRGVDVSAETCPHYLTLTEDDVQKFGAVAKCAPPLRSTAEQDGLWRELIAGNIQTVASDHSPSSPELKQGENFFKIWGGISGCQSTLSLLLTEGYHKRGMPLEQIAALTSSNAAQRFGLTAKGHIKAGADADLTLVDINASYTLNADDLFYRHKISPYVGMELRGKVTRTLAGGKTVFLNGEVSDG
jgi:allantoinase